MNQGNGKFSDGRYGEKGIGVFFVSIFIFFVFLIFSAKNEADRLNKSLTFYKNRNVFLEKRVDSLESENNELTKKIKLFSDSRTVTCECADSNLKNSIQEVFDKISSIRGLGGKLPKSIDFMTREESVDYIKSWNKNSQDERMKGEEKLWKFLGLLPQNIDLEKLLEKVYNEQIAGFYDPGTKRLVVISNEKNKNFLTSEEKLILSHELTHLLQDQNFSLLSEFESIPKEEDDEYMAKLALIEGDATFSMSLFLTKMSENELGEVLDINHTLKSDVLDSSPSLVKESILFPYEYGMKFISYFYYEKGQGWKFINKIYHDPPVSTEMIMNPKKYEEKDLPKEVYIDSNEKGNKQSIYKSTIGQFGYYMIFSNFLDKDESFNCSSGWGGDSLEFFGDLVVLKSFWDSEEDLEEAYNCFVKLEEKFWFKENNIDISIKKDREFLLVNFSKNK